MLEVEAKTSSIVELEGGIKVLQDNMKTLDTTKKERERTLKDKFKQTAQLYFCRQFL